MTARTMSQAFAFNFLGNTPGWYKATIVGFLLLNALLAATLGGLVTGWALIAEFIFCLVMALKCYPLQPGGLLVIEAVMLGLTTTESIYEETFHNFPVIMLLMFMVAGIYHLDVDIQAAAFFLATGALSAISDNVFVATIYITEIANALEVGTLTREHFELLAVAINTGTNLPSVATPNGQAAFLFLLTSAVAPLVRLSYGRMVWMALPYTIVLTSTGLACVLVLL
jgi:Na+/H+ antiporter NhaB